MATNADPGIILYDLACTKGVCFSPTVWRIRAMLNYKQIPYKTIFLEFPDIEPTLKSVGIKPHAKDSPGYRVDYTVPAIHHVSTNTYIMDSAPIAEFLERTYPTPPLTLTSELATEIQQQARKTFYHIYTFSLLPREVNVLSPRSAEYFRRRTETSHGQPWDEIVAGLNKEEEVWNDSQDNMMQIGRLIETNKADGPFLLGTQPSLLDFQLAGALQCARMFSEAVFQRHCSFPGFMALYEACQPYMQRKD